MTVTSKAKAIAGSAPDFLIPSDNFASFILSKPYSSQELGETPASHPLFVDPPSGAQLTHCDLKRLVLQCAAGLRHRLGLLPTPYYAGSAALLSPVVMLHLPNCIQYPVLEYGALAAGLTVCVATTICYTWLRLVSTLVNPALTPSELAATLHKARPAVILSSAFDKVHEALVLLDDNVLKQRFKRTLMRVDPEDPSFERRANEQDFRVLLQPTCANSLPHYDEDEARRRVAFILWSSGTSGQSKGVLLSHYSLIANNVIAYHGNPLQRSGHRYLGLAPFCHTFGNSQILSYGPATGATVYLMRKFSLELMFDYIQRYKITFLQHAPPVAVMLAKSPLVARYDLSSFRHTTSGGAPLGADVIEAVYKRTGILIKLGFGTSEAGTCTSQQATTWQELEPQLGTAGKPCPGVSFRIADIETGQTKLIGEEGEILIKSPSVMLGYLNDEAATADAFDADGWQRTGDIGLIDERGYLRIVDRLKELIKVNAFQVTPAELEGCLNGSPLIDDAAVTGVQDVARATEMPRAWIVLSAEGARLDDVELAHAIRVLTEKRLVKYKRLRGGVVVVDSIPKSPTGKILRRLLRDCRGREVPLYDERASRL